MKQSPRRRQKFIHKILPLKGDCFGLVSIRNKRYSITSPRNDIWKEK